MGLIGFIAYYGMFIIAIVASLIRVSREQGKAEAWIVPAVIALSNFVVIKSVFSQQEGHALAFALLGMLVAFLAKPPSSPVDDDDISVARSGPAGLAAPVAPRLYDRGG